jgi:hypothetical protein
MKRYILRTMGTLVGVNLRNFDGLPRPYALQPASDDHDADIEIDLYKSTSDGSSQKISEDAFAGIVKETDEGRYCQIYDFNGTRTSCFFENEKMLNYVFDSVVNSSLHAFQASLGMIFLHAASIEIGEKACIFIAPSGGGKSTISALAAKKGYRILGDDSCCVKKREDKYYVRVFPSSAAFSDEDNLREVEAVFFLKKSSENGIKELSAGEAVRKAMPEATNMYYDYARPGGRDIYRSHVFGFLSSMFDSVRFGVLEFNKGGEVFSCLAAS